MLPAAHTKWKLPHFVWHIFHHSKENRKQLCTAISNTVVHCIDLWEFYPENCTFKSCYLALVKSLLFFLERNDARMMAFFSTVESQKIDEIFCRVVFLMKGVTSDNEVRVNVLMYMYCTTTWRIYPRRLAAVSRYVASISDNCCYHMKKEKHNSTENYSAAAASYFSYCASFSDV